MGVEVAACETNDHKVVLKFIKENIFSRFGILGNMIGTYGSAQFRAFSMPAEPVISNFSSFPHNLIVTAGDFAEWKDSDVSHPPLNFWSTLVLHHFLISSTSENHLVFTENRRNSCQ